MLDPVALRRAVDLQTRSYELLRWMVGAIDRGFIAFDTAHTYATFPEAAFAWLDEHHADLPLVARPAREDLLDFARFFGTYLETSFELVRDPGQVLFSPEAHCFCPMCSWLVDAPRLRTKKVGPADKQRADRLELGALRALAAELGVPESDDDFTALKQDPVLREPIARLAYARDLLARVRGATEGPATLALFRRFAWTREGSPRKDFVLRADDLLDAEALLRARLAA